MPRYFLKRLTVEGFRGVNNECDPLDLRFQPESVNSVYAVNGSGKSSIFEALFYLIYGNIPKLESLQAAEKPQNYYCNRFHSKNSATISVEFQPDDGSEPVIMLVERNTAGERKVSSPSGHADPDEFLSTLRESFALLDSRTFARFIEDSPLRRGRTFSALLGFSDYSDCRQSLQAVSDTRNLNSDLETKVLETKILAAQKMTQDALSSMRLNFEKVTGQSFDDLSKLNEYAEEIHTALGSVELLKPYFLDTPLEEIDFNELKTAIKTEEGGAKRLELEKIIESISALDALTVYDSEVTTVEMKMIEALIEERDYLLDLTHGDLFKRLYESANELLAQDEWMTENKCPLCESTLSFTISDHIEKQLSQYSDAATKISEIKEAWKISVWKKSLLAYEVDAQLAIKPDDQQFAKLDRKFVTGEISSCNLESAMEWTSDLADKVVERLDMFKRRKELLENELPPSLVHLVEQVEYGRQFKAALQSYREGVRQENLQQARLDIRERWKKFISNARTIFAGAEAALTESRIISIDAEYKSMFRDIMQVDDVVPDLQRTAGKEDLHVQLSEFHGLRRLSAQALLSESYRNALAISVFLAAALKHSGIPRFVVLDDVTSSFDAGHQFYLMELIRTKLQQPLNSNGLQFIILSHDGLLEKYFDRLGGESDWHHNSLQGTPPMGAIVNRAQGAERLKSAIESLLSAGQVTQAAPLIRQYLEYKLQQIIRKVNIPVPIDFAIKDTSRTVSHSLDAINSAIELQTRAGTLVMNEQQVRDINNLHVPAIIGNWVNHYETGTGSSLSAPVLFGVVESIDALAECFKYDDVAKGTVVRRWYKSLNH